MDRERKNRRVQTALITGASSGIGQEFAKIFATNGFRLIITARSRERLEKTAELIRKEYNAQVTVISADLSKSDGAQKLYDEVKALGIQVDQLVNCAGAGKAGTTIDTDTQIMVDLINLNIVSVTLLSKLFGKDMVKQGYGKILNVASLGAYIPNPNFNVYGPTKAYELFLSEAMSGELAGSGVSVSVLCPGPTRTNWTQNAGKKDSKTALDPKVVARKGYIGMQKNQLVIIPAIRFKLERFVMGLLPAKAQIAFINKWQNDLINGD